jgi:hypothetical protein
MSSPLLESKNKPSKKPAWSRQQLPLNGLHGLISQKREISDRPLLAATTAGGISATYQPAHVVICGARCLATILFSKFTIALHRNISLLKLCNFQRSSQYCYVKKFDSIYHIGY